MRAFVEDAAYARAPEVLVITRRRQARRHRLDGACLRRGVRRGGGPGGRRADRQPVAGPGVRRAGAWLPASAMCRTGIFCVVKTSNAGGDVQDMTLSDGRPAVAARRGARRRWGRGAAVRRPGGPLGGRRRGRRDPHPRARSSEARQARYRSPSCCSPGSAPRAHGPATSPGRSRAGRPARSSTPRARSPTRSARRARIFAPRQAPRRPG